MKTTSNYYARSRNGFTLVEVLLTFAIAGVAMASASSILKTVLYQFHDWQRISAQERESSIAFNLLSADIRGAFFSAEQSQLKFVGHREELGDALELCRIADREGDQLAMEFIRYELEEDHASGMRVLRRTAQNLINTNQKKTDLCPSVKSFHVTYFDGSVWSKDWAWDDRLKKPFDGIKGLPLLVSIELIWEETPHQTRSITKTIPVMTTFLNRSFHV